MKVKYSKPVLTGGLGSSYKENYKFDLEILNGEDALCNDGIIRLLIKVNMNSKLLKELIINKDANIGVKVQTAYFSGYYSYPLNDENITIEIDTRDLKKVDCIECTAFITSNKYMNLPYSVEMNDIYMGEEYIFHKNEIMGESSTDKLNYKAAGNPFIQITCSETQKEGIGYRLGENVIEILVNEELNIAYNKIQTISTNGTPKNILNSFLAYNAIQYAFLKVIEEGVELYCQKDWFKALDYNFEEPNYENLKDFLSSMSGDNIKEIDINLINRVVQKMLNNQVSKKIVETWESINGSSIKTN